MEHWLNGMLVFAIFFEELCTDGACARLSVPRNLIACELYWDPISDCYFNLAF